jgi:SAM-dependent methyltransferase
VSFAHSPCGPNVAGLEAKNKKAWDDLYGATPQPVWGRRPIGFLEEFLAYVTPPLGSSSRVLDAGAGDGRNVAALEATGARVAICDASHQGLRKVAELRGQTARRAQCDLSRLPYRDGVFDFLLMTDVIETLPDPEPALAEARRVLAPGGMLLCNIPGHADPIADDAMSQVAGESFLYRDTYFFRFTNVDAASAQIARHGFEIVMVESRRWVEDPHPSFRSYAHEHISNVFLARRV